MTTFSSQRQSPEVAQVEQRLLDIFNILGKKYFIYTTQVFCRDTFGINIFIQYYFVSNRKGFEVFEKKVSAIFYVRSWLLWIVHLISFQKDFCSGRSRIPELEFGDFCNDLERIPGSGE